MTDVEEATTFADLGLGDAVMKALKDVGYETPSAIQAATIPPLLAGRDVLGVAQAELGESDGGGGVFGRHGSTVVVWGC